MRARALRAPVFLSSLPPQTGRCGPPPPPRPSQLCFFLLDLQKYIKSAKYLHMKSTELCLASSKILTPHPLSTQRVCPPPHQRRGGGGYTLAGKCDHLILLFISLLILLVLYSASSYSCLLIFKLFVVLQTCVLNTHLAKVHT